MMHSMPFAFNEPFGMPRRTHVHAPPRTPSPPPEAEPRIEVDERRDAYFISCEAPPDWKANADARIEASGHLLLEGSLHPEKPVGFYSYETRDRAGLFSQPSHRALQGVIPPGRLLRGSAPSRQGWIALDDDESFVLDDGSLELVGRPRVPRPVPFRKRVTLPSDADVQKATSKSLGRGDGLLITVPRVVRRRQPVPINTNRAERPKPAAPSPPPPSPVSSAPRTRKSASAYKEARAPAPPTAAAKKKDVSADDYKAQHKKQAAARRAAAEQLSSADALRSLQVTTDGPVLAECDSADEQNVQSPREEVEEWVAKADGTFARSDDSDSEEEDPWVKDAKMKDEDLAYYGF